MTRAHMIAALEKLEDHLEEDFPEMDPRNRRVIRRIREALERELVGAAKGGKVRAERLSPRRRSAIARKGASSVGRGNNGKFTRKSKP